MAGGEKMTNAKIVLSKLAHSQRLKSFHTNAALILTTLLVVVATTSVATAQTYTDLFNFDGTHGTGPIGILAQGRDGNLLGTTGYGGTNSNCSGGCGVVFRVTPSGKGRVLYNFDGAHGGQPEGGLTLGSGGDFYGTTWEGGANGYGTIFKITKTGSLTNLYSFCAQSGCADGDYPAAAPIQGADGNFYGTASNGTAYKITSSGAFTSLRLTDGNSFAPLLQASDGNFYGTTINGGSNGDGTVLKMTPKGVVTIVHSFDDTDGASPYFATVIQDADGNFYGTTAGGGSYGEGVVFKLTPHGAITVVHNFPDPNYPNDGNYPWGGLVQATDGNFYGVTVNGGTDNCGVIFQITPAGAYSILYNFDRKSGSNPESTPMQHTNGKIYGLAEGGTSGSGVVYSLDMGLGPFVRLVSTSGKVEKTVEVLGQGFTNTTAVAFNGTPATFSVISDTYLRATVPSGTTTGPLTVTTPGGTLTSNKPFRVTPVILSFSPTSGAVGTSVTITGNGLTQTTRVTFGGVKATSFTVNSDTQVMATVPTGAQTGHIAITTTGGWTWSTGIFTVTQ